MCRVCHIQYGDLENNIHDFEDSPHSYWSEDEYNKIVNSLDQEVEDEAENEFVEKHLITCLRKVIQALT